MGLSDLASRLLRLHADRQGQLFYGTAVLGSLFRDKDLERLDAAYLELVGQELMEPAGAVVSYFGDPKALYRATKKGADVAQRQESAA